MILVLREGEKVEEEEWEETNGSQNRLKDKWVRKRWEMANSLQGALYPLGKQFIQHTHAYTRALTRRH